MTALAPTSNGAEDTRPDEAAIRSHLEFLTAPVREAHPDPRVEIAWGDPESGPNNAKTFRLDELHEAITHAIWVNQCCNNVYVGVTLKRVDAPLAGRTSREHAALATCLPIDIDKDFVFCAGKLRGIAKPQLMVLTGQIPETRGQLWIRHIPTEDLDLWDDVNRRAVQHCEGDLSALGTYRLMRLAGSVNFPPQRKRERGYVVERTITQFIDAPAYDLCELKDRLPAVQDGRVRAAQGNRIPALSARPQLPADLKLVSNTVPKIDSPPVEKMREMLQHLSARNCFAERNEVTNDETGRIVTVGWRECGMALKAAYGDEVGLELWGETHIDERARTDAPTQWASFAAEARAGDVTVRTLIKAAKDTGFTFGAVSAVLPGITGEEPPADVGDVKNGRLFAEMFRKQLLHIHETGEWLHFHPQQGWVAASPGEVDRAAKEVLSALGEKAAEAFKTAKPNDPAVKELMRHISRTSDAPRLNAMIEVAKSEPGMTVRLNEFDSDPMLLGVANGVLDLRKGTLLPVSPEVLVSKRCAVAFDPSAACPRFEQFMREVQPDPDVRLFLQRFLGYCLTGLVVEHLFLFLFGLGANGKSVFVELLAWLLGDYGRKIATEMLMHHQRNPAGPSPDIVSLKGLRLAYANETEEGRRLAEAHVKDMTGGDTLTGRVPYGKAAITFDPTHKLIVSGNHKPEIIDTSFGMWRRVALTPFEVTIPEADRDPKLLEKLKREGSGILNRMLAGLREYQENGLQIPQQIAGATAAYRDEQDIIGEWIRENCNTGAGSSAHKHALYHDYTAWCDANGHKPLAQGRLTRRLNDRNFRLAPDKRTVHGLARKRGSVPSNL